MLDDFDVEVDLTDLVMLHIELTPSEFEKVDKLDWWDVECADGETYGPYVLYQKAIAAGAFVCECGIDQDTDAEVLELHSISPVLHRCDFDLQVDNPAPNGEEWAGRPYHA